MMDGQNDVPAVIGPDYILPDASQVIFRTTSLSRQFISGVDNEINLSVHHWDKNEIDLLHDINIIAVLRKEFLFGRWKAYSYRDTSTAKPALLFSLKKSKSDLLVSVANSNKECDFRISGRWSEKDYKVYRGDSIIAEMKSMGSFQFEFMVTISPNVDYAFVMSLFTIIQAMKNSHAKKNRVHHMAEAVAGV